MVAVGVGAVVAGGLVAAVTSPLNLKSGSWLAAYLVLVVGVAQVAMGLARTYRGDSARGQGWVQLGLWNTGNVAVMTGTLISHPWLVTAGSVLLLPAVGVALAALRWRDRTDPRPWWLTVYGLLLVVLAVSIPIGIVLSYLRHG